MLENVFAGHKSARQSQCDNRGKGDIGSQGKFQNAEWDQTCSKNS